MKVVSILVGALCVSSALAACVRTLSGTVDSSTGVARYDACKNEALSSSQCPDGTFPAVKTTETSDPLFLVVATNGKPAQNSGQTGYFDDHVHIYFKESAKYYGKASEGPAGLNDPAPKVVFGPSSNPNTATQNVFASYDNTGLTVFDVSKGCAWTHHFSLDWNKFLSEYSQSGQVGVTAKANEYKRTQSGSLIVYDVDFNVVNYEWVSLFRPGPGGSNGADISVERVVRHALPFTIRFETQATIEQVSIQAFSTITSLAAIVSQSVSLVDFNGHANAEVLLYTSVQWPFVIDELRIHSSSRTNVDGDSFDEFGTVSSPLNAVTYSGQYQSTGTTQAVDANGPTLTMSGRALSTGSGSTCLANGICTQVWPLHLSTVGTAANSACDFTGVYNVLFTLRCHDSVNPNQCPINLYQGQRIIPGFVNDDQNPPVTGTNANFFKLSISSSNHCTQTVDTIGLDAALTTHGSPKDVTAQEALDAFTARNAITYKTTHSGVPQPKDAEGAELWTFAPVSASNDPDGVSWGPETDASNAELNYDVSTAPNGKTAFLNGQWVFGVALVKVQQATVVNSEFSSLTISGFGTPNDVRPVLVDGQISSTFKTNTLDALKLAFVDDSTNVNINVPGKRISHPYFFFQVNQEAFNINPDQNKPITFEGTIKVTYENAASVAREQLEKLVPFRYTMQADSRSRDTSVSASIGIGNGATGSASTANSTFLGVSSSTAAGVALAVGVVVGLLVGLLVSASRRRPAPTKTESQVQLTNSAATSAV